MKITAVETYAVWGGARNFLFVTVDPDAGIAGVGESGLTGRERGLGAAPRGRLSGAAPWDPHRGRPVRGATRRPRRRGGVVPGRASPPRPGGRGRPAAGGGAVPPLLHGGSGPRRGHERAPA